MSAFSILFGEGQGEGRSQGRSPRDSEPPYFRDLNLDAFVESATAGMDEYDLKSLYYSLLDDEAAIVYRQNVVHDLVGRPTLGMVKEFAIGMRRSRELDALASKLQNEYQKGSWFLDEVETYCATVVEFARALGTADVRSRGMTAWKDYLGAYIESARFAAIRGEADALREALSSVRYCLFIRHGAVRVKKYEGEAEYGDEIERMFGRFAQGAGKDYLAQFTDSRDLNRVEADILDRVANLYPDVFGELGEFRSRNASYADPGVVAFDREIQFYVSYLDYIAPIRRSGSAFCYPKVSRASKELRSRGGYDIVLASKLAQKGAAPVPNDFFLEGAERILVVTGPNQGGKTTFARAFGQLHYLARLGLPVPGSEARLLLCDRILTHFDREERVEAQRGRLLEDLVRDARPPRRGHGRKRHPAQRDLHVHRPRGRDLSRRAGPRPDHGARCALRLRHLHRRVGEARREDSEHDEHGGPREARREDLQDPAQAAGRTGLRAFHRREVRPYARADRPEDRRMKPCLLGEGLPGEGQAGDSGQARESSSSDLKRDLGLPILFEAMAAADEFVYGAAESVVLSGAADVETILYRQAVLGDCLKNRDIVRDLYSIIGETLGEEKKSSLWFSHQSPSTVLHTAIGALDLLLSALGRIRDILSARSSDFASTGFASLVRTLNVEVGDDFLEYAGNHLHELKFGGGALVGADLGVGCKGRNYRALKPGRKGMAERLRERKNSLTVQIPDGDEAGSRALEELRDRGINRVADSLARSRDHVLGFLGVMRFELAFYIGCINLHERLAGIGMGLCLPLPARPEERAHRGKGLYDICLALTLGGPVVGNDLEADGRSLFVVTGANQGESRPS